MFRFLLLFFFSVLGQSDAVKIGFAYHQSYRGGGLSLQQTFANMAWEKKMANPTEIYDFDGIFWEERFYDQRKSIPMQFQSPRLEEKSLAYNAIHFFFALDAPINFQCISRRSNVVSKIQKKKKLFFKGSVTIIECPWIYIIDLDGLNGVT